MRLRNIPGAREEMLVNPFVIQSPAQYRGQWNALFGNKNPLHIEIGMGKGRFLTTLAMQNPDVNYLGIERYASVLIRAIEKQEELKLPNLRFICIDANEVENFFAEGEVDRIYLNFSDPWPKDRHAKRRLTSRQFLAHYRQVLAADGHLAFKTDNRGLFDFSVVEVQEAGWDLSDVTYDLHHSPYAEGNVLTEYEEKFSAMGNPIYRLVARMPQK